MKLAGFEKRTAEDLTSSADIDTIMLADAIQAVDDTTGTADASVKNGLITFKTRPNHPSAGGRSSSSADRQQ